MTRTNLTSVLILLLTITLLMSCNSGGQKANNASKSSPSNSAAATQTPSQTSSNTNTNTSPSPSSAPSDSAALKGSTAPQLIGEYQIKEIQEKGVVTMVSSIQTSYVFLADGGYSRTSKKDGRTYHADSGRFRIDPPDKLVLTIMISGQGLKQTIQNPPVQKSHTFTLSADGDQLTLTSEKGSTAVLRRVAKPKAG